MIGLGIGLGIGTQSGVGGGGGPAPAPLSAVVFGQSEMEYLLSPDPTYRQIAQPTPGDGNVILFTQGTVSDQAVAAPVRTVVNAASVAAGQVNPAMAALSALLAYARPGRTFVVGDGAVPGTGRNALFDGNEVTGRKWADFVDVVNAVEAETGTPIGHLIECWYNSDASNITNFRNAFWPAYFGTDGAGASFTLGSTNPVTGAVVANCLWDGTAATNAKGRGIFARSDTLWHILTPMPFNNGPVDPEPEATTFSQGLRLSEPARATMIGLASDSLAQSVGLRVGPSAHLTDFGGGIHPVTDDPDGQILLMWPIAVALLRASGMTVGEPTVVGIEGPEDGTYADLVIDLPNNGTLTTLRTFRGLSMPANPSPHQQAVTGIEVNRSGGARRPVYRTTETTYPIAHRGTVTITDTGSGSPRRGRVRVTPETPFAFGDSLSYLRGQATAMLQQPRDVDNALYQDMLIEHVPGLYQAGALYPFEGVAVRPFQEEVAVNVPAPAFTPRGAFFDGASRYGSDAISVPATQNGLFSVWFRNNDSAWNAVAGRRIFQKRVGTSILCELNVASSGQLQLRLNAGGANIVSFRAPGNTNFAVNQWYHLMACWTGGTNYRIFVNGTEVATAALASLDFAGQTFTRAGFGSASTLTQYWLGDLAHLWLGFSQTLDLSVLANREKFALAGQPVNLGGNGELVTGTAPEWYYDGDAPAWSNQGTAGNIPLTGALTASSPPPSY